ncbi:MAG: tRNA (5-methylaminomethyl-2-thiouridine)(34)-methyltransferase MnmD [Pseudomonadota bacterium]
MNAPHLDWSGETPRSITFDDPYYAESDGAAEAAHVFLDGNGLPGRLRPGFHIAELGFGTGLNLLVTLAAAGNVPFRFTSFEAYPMAAEDMARALARWPHLTAGALIEAQRAGERRFQIGPAEVEVIVGDARLTLPRWRGRADAWYLDGFAPAKNPELWEADLLAQVAAHTSRGGTFATYTAASAVRHRLTDAGFAVERRPGFGHKRHMSVGHL